jgi:ketosteroid isomerase-like protein
MQRCLEWRARWNASDGGSGMAMEQPNVTPSTPTAQHLLAQWRDRYRAADFVGLTELYHRDAFLSGSTAHAHIGRDEIQEYFDSLGQVTDPDVEFSEITSRLVRPEVLVVLALAVFRLNGVTLPMRLTQVWVEDWSGWLIASHHASPPADIREGLSIRN